MQYSLAHQTGPEWRALCQRVLPDITGDGAGGDLAFIYIDHHLAAQTDRIVDYLRAHSGIPHWVGSVGMGLCSSGRETYDEPAIAVLRTDIPAADMRIIPPLTDGAGDFLETSADWRNRTLASVAVVHGDPGSPAVPQLLVELGEGLQGGFLTGGITSSETLQVQIADHAVGGGLSGVLLSGQVALQVGLSQGCTLIGHKHRVSECRDNLVMALDGRPALDVLKDEIGSELAGDLRQLGGLIFAALPIPGSDTADYLVRNLLGFEPGTGLIAIGQTLEAGQEIQFARRDMASAKADLGRMLDLVSSRLPGPAKGALYHTCLGRGRNLFEGDSAELKLLQAKLGDVPLVGFYANGEIFHNRLYGYTGVLTVFC